MVVPPRAAGKYNKLLELILVCILVCHALRIMAPFLCPRVASAKTAEAVDIAEFLRKKKNEKAYRRHNGDSYRWSPGCRGYVVVRALCKAYMPYCWLPDDKQFRYRLRENAFALQALDLALSDALMTRIEDL